MIFIIDVLEPMLQEHEVMEQVVAPPPSGEGGTAPNAEVFFHTNYSNRCASAPFATARSHGRRRHFTSVRGGR